MRKLCCLRWWADLNFSVRVFCGFWSLLIFVSRTSALELGLKSASREVGENLIVNCRDEGGLETKWIGPNGKILGPNSEPKVRKASYGTYLLFEEIKATDGGVYKCSTDLAQEQFTLTIAGLPINNDNKPYSRPGRPSRPVPGGLPPREEPIYFVDTPARQFAEENSNFSIKCEVRGTNSTPTWHREDGRPILGPKFNELGDGLAISKVEKDDAGIYVCRALQRQTGAMKEQKIDFQVHHKPYSVLDRVEFVYGYENSILNLTCEVESNPRPQFSWFRKKSKHKTDPIREQTIESHNSSTLTVHFKDNSVLGIYVCEARNDFGMTEVSYSVERGQKPNPPKRLTLNKAGSDFLDLSVDNDDEETYMPGMEPQGYHFKYRHSEESEWQETDYATSTENSYTLYDLETDSEYEVEVASRNIAGMSDYTRNKLYFRTLEATNKAPSIAYSSTLLFIVTFLLFSI